MTTTITNNEIPEWVLCEVLTKLPFEALHPMKLVSKQWHRTISDPSFARMYFSRSRLWTLVSGFAPEHSITDRFFPTNCLDLLTLPRNRQVEGLHYVLVGTSNGFLLYGPRVEHGIYNYIYHHLQTPHDYIYKIRNPVTGQTITLPPSNRRFEFVATGFVTRVNESNLLESFRVVRVGVYRTLDGLTKIDVYNSETREWELHEITDQIYFYKWKNPVVLGQTLHWIITQHRVASYDPYDEPGSVRVARLPSHDEASYGLSKREFELEDTLFDQHNGRLRYVEAKLMGPPGHRKWTDVSVWVPNDYGSGEWSLQHRVRINGLSRFSRPLCFHPFDSNILYVLNDSGLFSYDFGARKLKVEDSSRGGYTHLLPYSMSYFLFVIPTCPVLIHPSLLGH